MRYDHAKKTMRSHVITLLAVHCGIFLNLEFLIETDKASECYS